MKRICHLGSEEDEILWVWMVKENDLSQSEDKGSFSVGHVLWRTFIIMGGQIFYAYFLYIYKKKPPIFASYLD